MSRTSVSPPLLPLPRGIARVFNQYFERASIVYHTLFILFLLYLVFVRNPRQEISVVVIRALGTIVLCYGFIIMVWGPSIINRRV